MKSENKDKCEFSSLSPPKVKYCTLRSLPKWRAPLPHISNSNYKKRGHVGKAKLDLRQHLFAVRDRTADPSRKKRNLKSPERNIFNTSLTPGNSPRPTSTTVGWPRVKRESTRQRPKASREREPQLTRELSGRRSSLSFFEGERATGRATRARAQLLGSGPLLSYSC